MQVPCSQARKIAVQGARLGIRHALTFLESNRWGFVCERLGRVLLRNLALEGNSIMRFSKSRKYLAVSLLSLFVLPALTLAQHYKQTNLVSNLASISTPNPPDPNLKNPWGLTRSPGGSPWWVANNNSGTSTLYSGTGAAIPINGTGNVTVPPPLGSPAGTQSTPTGVVFNGSTTDFLVAPGKSAHFIFATEDGTIAGWNSGQNAVLVVANSNNGSPDGAVD